jgi:hypothetical protein
MQIGNIFSGLFLSIHTNNAVAAAGLTTIRKPVLPAEHHTAAASAAAAAATGNLTMQQQQQMLGSAGSSNSSSSSTKATARRRSWMERPYLKQKLTDGAAAVKVGGKRGCECTAIVLLHHWLRGAC